MSSGNEKRQFGDFGFDPADGRLQHLPSGQAVQLRPQAARLLLALLAAEGGVVARETLHRAVWDRGAVVDFEAGLAALVRELRQAFDQSGGQAGLLETIPRRGYRLRTKPAPDAGASPAGAGLPRRTWLAAALVAVGLLLTGWWLASRPPGELPAVGPAGAGQPRALAVLPFQSYGQPAEDGPRLDLLLADAVLSELWRVELDGVELIGRATLMPYGAREDIATAVARDLGAELLMEGSLLMEEGGWQVTARLLAMPGGRVLWSETVAMPAASPPPVAETTAALVASLGAAWPRLARDLSTH